MSDPSLTESSREREPEDPWQKLSPEQRKRAERHLIILYAAMILLVVSPFVMFFFLKK